MAPECSYQRLLILTRHARACRGHPRVETRVASNTCGTSRGHDGRGESSSNTVGIISLLSIARASPSPALVRAIAYGQQLAPVTSLPCGGGRLARVARAPGGGCGIRRIKQVLPSPSLPPHWQSRFRNSEPGAIEQPPIDSGFRAVDGHRADGFRIIGRRAYSAD